ncbi:hypothetical protein [Parasphingorhabdus sp.]|jgi:hypothetical protein|uniref:hypothetical protein n=1 Tax=Parasphingorhabdus sp. TaxID=2709688 RepID=UPI003B31B1D9
MIIKIGKLLSIVAIGLLFFAYSNFAATVFPSANVADYVKNHFVREIIFGATLAVFAIASIVRWTAATSLLVPLSLGSIVVLPFWVASLFGWSIGGLSEVWGESIQPQSAYLLHGPQVTLFYLGMFLLFLGARSLKMSSP